MSKSTNSFFVDVHCHLDLYEKAEINVKEAVKNAKSLGVSLIVANGVNPESNRKVLSLAKEYPEIKASLGLYPIDALKYKEEEINAEIKFIEDNKKTIIYGIINKYEYKTC